MSVMSRAWGPHPDLVLVDSNIIAEAPVRFLASGMGDALATYFEAQASVLSNSENFLKYGRFAKKANELGVVNEAHKS